MMLAIDIGGTKTALALYDGRDLIDKKVLPTACDDWHEYSDLLLQATEQWEFERVSVATTGRIVKGIMKPLNRHMISFWADLPLQSLLESQFNCPVAIYNDAAAAAWSEYQHCDHAHVMNLLYITVSTGVGTGLVLNGRLHTSTNGLASHGGHMHHSVSSAPELSCSCGRAGCVEAIASGTAISKRATELLGRHCTTPEVFERMDSDERCAALVKESAQAIAAMIIDSNALIGLDKVVIGGGVGLNPRYRAEVESQLQREAGVFQIPIRQAQLAVDSGLLGAAQLAEHLSY